MKKKFLKLLCLSSIVCSTVSCSNTSVGEYDEDVYDENGNLIITFFGIDIDSLQSPTKDTELVLNAIEEKFKVDFNFISGSPEGWKTVLNQNIGGGDIPDIWFHEVDQPQYSSWLEDEYLMDFEPYLKDYPNIKASFERYNLADVKSYLGGKLYGYPIVLNDEIEEDLCNVHGMYYRRDWYDAVKDRYTPKSGVKIKDPEDATFDYNNFYDLLEAFTYGDPDNNGKDDTYGYAMTKDGGIYWWYPILCMFGVTSLDWSWNQTANRWEPDIIQDKMKPALDFLAKLYDNGLINSNYATTATKARMKNEFLNGSAGVMVHETQFEHAVGILKLMEQYLTDGKEMNDVVRGFPVVTGVDGTKTLWGHSNKYGYRSINNFCSPTKKEKILDIMEWMLSEEGMMLLNNGIEGTHYTLNSDGTINSLLGVDSSGEPFTFYDNNIARGIYFLKGLVSWSTPVPKTSKYYNNAIAIQKAWKQEYLKPSTFAYCHVDPSFGITASELNDITTIAYQKIVGKTSAQERETTWTEYVANYKKKGSSYIIAMNKCADEMGIKH